MLSRCPSSLLPKYQAAILPDAKLSILHPAAVPHHGAITHHVTQTLIRGDVEEARIQGVQTPSDHRHLFYCHPLAFLTASWPSGLQYWQCSQRIPNHRHVTWQQWCLKDKSPRWSHKGKKSILKNASLTIHPARAGQVIWEVWYEGGGIGHREVAVTTGRPCFIRAAAVNHRLASPSMTVRVGGTMTMGVGPQNISVWQCTRERTNSLQSH